MVGDVSGPVDSHLSETYRVFVRSIQSSSSLYDVSGPVTISNLKSYQVFVSSIRSSPCLYDVSSPGRCLCTQLCD